MSVFIVHVKFKHYITLHLNYIKICRYSHFYNGKSNSVYGFSVKPSNIRESKSRNELLRKFSGKSDGNVTLEKTYRLKLKLNNIGRKMKTVIRYIFTLNVMPTNFIRFCEKKKKKFQN